MALAAGCKDIVVVVDGYHIAAHHDVEDVQERVAYYGACGMGDVAELRFRTMVLVAASIGLVNSAPYLVLTA